MYGFNAFLSTHESASAPPVGAGDCAAPKLFQRALSKGYEPVALAEFWWGKSPSNEVRRHGLYYPACRGKCQPILEHILGGMEVEGNPNDIAPIMNNNEGSDNRFDELEILYEDWYECNVATNILHGQPWTTLIG